jgi:hypothetical protein
VARDEACDQQPAGEFLCRRVGDDPLRDLDDAAVRDGDIDERLVLGPPALTQKEIEGHSGEPGSMMSTSHQNSTSSSSNSSGSALAPATHSFMSGIAITV